MASDFIRNLREESKKGIYGRLKQGYYPMPAPLGYLNNGAAKPKTLDPKTAPLVRQAFELYASRRFTLRSLGQELYRLGLRRPDGKPYLRNRLSKLLNNPFYSGLIRIRKTGQYFAGIHEPLISRKLFEQVQEVLQGKLNTRVKKHDFLYRRRLTCKGCSYSLIGETAKGFVYYRCHTLSCRTTSVKEEYIDRAVLEQFARLRFRPDQRAHLKQEIERMRANVTRQRQEIIAALKLRLSQTEERLNRLTDAYIDRLIELDLFEARKKALLSERLDLEVQLKDGQAGKRDSAEELTKFLERADAAYSAYKGGTVEEKRDLLDALTSNRIVDRKTPVILLNLPFNLIAERQRCADGGPRRDIHLTWKSLLDDLGQHVLRERR
ncbi:MAG: recombinase family protein [Acidobacteriaceae bacterium]|nr:recombinase family protein [Acidobacteriaceae bacterium]